MGPGTVAGAGDDGAAGLPVSAWLAWWTTAWLRGHVVTDHLLDALDGLHLAAGVPGHEEPQPILGLLAFLRADGADRLGLALPTPGDPVGLGGERVFNDAALEAGQGCVSDRGWGLVPEWHGECTTWTLHPARPRQVVDVGEADRQLRAALVESANALADLDVARWRPEVADELMNLRHPVAVAAPPGTPARCVSLAARGAHATLIVELALADDGGARSAEEARQRREALTPLDRAARRALVAACSPEVWPPEGR